MAKFRKQTSRLIEELISLKNSRKSIDEFNFNFLENFSDNCSIMHSYLDEKKFSKDLTKIAYRQYFVFLVSCWETFFRDTFIYIYSKDSESIDGLLQKMNITESHPSLKEITLVELLSKSFNFQNIKDLESAYHSLWGDNFLTFICQTKTDTCGITGEISHGFSISSLIPDWNEVIEKSFEIRHKVVHDANYKPELDIQLIKKSEVLFLMIPQFTTYFLAKRFRLNCIALSDGKYSFPYIFSIHDILANDWVVVDEE